MSAGSAFIDDALIALSKCSRCGAQATIRHYRAEPTLRSFLVDFPGDYFCDACYGPAIRAEHGLSFPAASAGRLELLCAHCLVPYSADHRCQTSGGTP